MGKEKTFSVLICENLRPLKRKDDLWPGLR
jgi:hypothetical protein